MKDSGNNGISLEGAVKGLVSFRSGEVLLIEVSHDRDTWSAGFFLALTSDGLRVGGRGNGTSSMRLQR